MPSFTIIGDFTSRPFAGDDFHILCIAQASFRFFQLFCCLLPLAIILLLHEKRRNLTINGVPPWCPSFHDEVVNLVEMDRGGFLILTPDEEKHLKFEQDDLAYWFVLFSFAFVFLDLAWAGALWRAASVGTPTESKVRNSYLRPLIKVKLFFINLIPAGLLSIGIYHVHELRKNNYQCGDETPEFYPDDSAYFLFFSVEIVVFAIEIFIWISLAISFCVREVLERLSSLHDTHHRFQMYFGGCLRCLSFYLRGETARHFTHAKEIKDIAVAAMEFANNDTKMGIVLSDMYVGSKMLVRVILERKVSAIRSFTLQLRSLDVECDSDTSAAKIDAQDNEAEQDPISKHNKRDIYERQTSDRRKSFLGLRADKKTGKYLIVERELLTNESEVDKLIIEDAAICASFANIIYKKLPKAMEEFGDGEDGALCFSRPLKTLFDDAFHLKSIPGHEKTKLCYASFHNGLSSTPYAILVDEAAEAVVVTIRGTKSLEDFITDFHFMSQELDEVGKRCGFNGEGHYCHKGVLTRCKWLYNDIKKRHTLKSLFSCSSPYRQFKLFITGHSLGAGCAQMLSVMLRPSFPSLKCFAIGPPGCVLDEELADICEEFITCIVQQDDIIPRLSPSNAESLRNQLFEVLARVKVSKINLFKDVRNPCHELSLAKRNSAVLHPKESVNRDTEYYTKLNEYINERAEKNRRSGPTLYIPGKIIHLIDISSDGSQYVPYWATRYSFDEIVLSDRLITDHKSGPVADILKSIRLDQVDELPPDCHLLELMHDGEDEEYEEVTEATFFTCFKSTRGRYTFALAVLVTVTLVLSFMVDHSCDFFSRDAVISINDVEYKYPHMEFGLFGHELKYCLDEDGCDMMHNSTVEDAGLCFPFPPAFHPDGYMVASRAFSLFGMIFGSISFAIVWASTCLNLGRRTWLFLTCSLIASAICKSFVFLVLRTDLCTAERNEMENELPDAALHASCSISKFGKIAILSIFFWVFAALLSWRMSREASFLKISSDPLGVSNE